MSDLFNAIENTSVRGWRQLHAALPHILTVAGVGDEARGMLAGYAARTDDLLTVVEMLRTRLGDDMHRVQGWASAVQTLAAVFRDYERDVRTGDVNNPRWADALGNAMLARAEQVERIAAEIVAEG